MSNATIKITVGGGSVEVPIEDVFPSAHGVKPFDKTTLEDKWMSEPMPILLDPYLVDFKLDPICKELNMSHSEFIEMLVKDYEVNGKRSKLKVVSD